MSHRQRSEPQRPVQRSEAPGDIFCCVPRTVAGAFCPRRIEKDASGTPQPSLPLRPNSSLHHYFDFFWTPTRTVHGGPFFLPMDTSTNVFHHDRGGPYRSMGILGRSSRSTTSSILASILASRTRPRTHTSILTSTDAHRRPYRCPRITVSTTAVHRRITMPIVVQTRPFCHTYVHY